MQLLFEHLIFDIQTNFAKTLFWHNVTLFVLLNMPPKHYKNGKTVNLEQFLTYSLDQFLTYKHPNLGPNFISTAHIYMHMYVHVCICKWMCVYMYVCLYLSLGA